MLSVPDGADVGEQGFHGLFCVHAEGCSGGILVATAGCFGIFFPWDAHRPALYLGDGPATSRKCVIKISMELIG